MFGYNVKIRSVCTEDYHDGEQYGEWSQCYENYFKSIEQELKIPDLVSNEEIKDGEQCFIVWVEYSQGDSFGWGTCIGTEAVFVTKDLKLAKEVKEIINKHNKEENNFFIESTLSNGQKFSYGYVPWKGYFERLEEVHIDSGIVGL